MADAFVRLPGPADGPLLLVEGPETGLSVWRATDCEVWCSIGPLTRHRPSPGRRCIICRDDDADEAPASRALVEPPVAGSLPARMFGSRPRGQCVGMMGPT